MIVLKVLGSDFFCRLPLALAYLTEKLLTYEVKDDLEAALRARRPEARAKVIEDMIATGLCRRRERRR